MSPGVVAGRADGAGSHGTRALSGSGSDRAGFEGGCSGSGGRSPPGVCQLITPSLPKPMAPLHAAPDVQAMVAARQHVLRERSRWSGRPDLNRRPPVPQTGALPDCATPRQTGSLAPARVVPLTPSQARSRSVPSSVQSGPVVSGRPHGSCQRSTSCTLDGPTEPSGVNLGLGLVLQARYHARHGSGAGAERQHGPANAAASDLRTTSWTDGDRRGPHDSRPDPPRAVPPSVRSRPARPLTRGQADR